MQPDTEYMPYGYPYQMPLPARLAKDQRLGILQSLSETEKSLIGDIDDNVRIFRWGDALIIDRFKCPHCGCEKTVKHADIGIVECAWCHGEGRVIKPKPEPVVRDNSWRPFLPPR